MPQKSMGNQSGVNLSSYALQSSRWGSYGPLRYESAPHGILEFPMDPLVFCDLVLWNTIQNVGLWPPSLTPPPKRIKNCCSLQVYLEGFCVLKAGVDTSHLPILPEPLSRYFPGNKYHCFPSPHTKVPKRSFQVKIPRRKIRSKVPNRKLPSESSQMQVFQQKLSSERSQAKVSKQHSQSDSSQAMNEHP